MFGYHQYFNAKIYYIKGNVGVFVCLCVLYRNPNSWMDRDEIWHRGSPRWGEGSWGGGQPSTPHPQGMGCVKGVWGASGASTMSFGKNFIKQKLQGTPDLVGAF